MKSIFESYTRLSLKRKMNSKNLLGTTSSRLASIWLLWGRCQHQKQVKCPSQHPGPSHGRACPLYSPSQICEAPLLAACTCCGRPTHWYLSLRQRWPLHRATTTTQPADGSSYTPWNIHARWAGLATWGRSCPRDLGTWEALSSGGLVWSRAIVRPGFTVDCDGQLIGTIRH